MILLGFAYTAALVSLMYRGDKNSRLYALHRFVDVYPSITKPDRHVRFNEKLWTTTLVLIIYFAMTNVMLWGLSGQALDLFSGFRSIMAGASGTIMHLGIGPIVTGSIIMQLFAGAKIIRLDLSNSEDKAMYQGVQKLLVLIMIPIESIPQTYGFLDPTQSLIENYGLGWANAVIVAQLFAGSYLVFLLDELVSKWGIWFRYFSFHRCWSCTIDLRRNPFSTTGNKGIILQYSESTIRNPSDDFLHVT